MDKDVILVITTSYPSSADGSEAAGSFVADFVRELSKKSPVRVVAPGRSERIEGASGGHVWRFAAGSRPLSLLSPAKPWHWPAIAVALFSLRRQSLAASRDGRVAHVLALWILPSGWAARIVSKRHAVPYSVWALGSDIWALARVPLVGPLLAKVSRSAMWRFADGFQLARDAESFTGAPFDFLPSSRSLKVVRHAPARNRAPFRLLYLGRWHFNKGTDLLLEALKLLNEEDWTLIEEVHIAGGGPLEPVVRAGVEALSRAGRPIRLSGYLNSAEASRALGRADRLLLPSRIESIPVVFSDALCAALPIVSMPVGDIPELIRPGMGWVASGVSAVEFADAIRASFQDGHDESELSRCLKLFRPEGAAQRIIELMRGHS
ncbi:glycosyltransferase [Arenimonas caeni]|uniref:Glycosyl transferase family 1 domain-containing protein n=1 Tax=Arenimonas caeni TaxID=2058085 RepID=A0A2P6MBX5_9GAMM|nr:hypothetical protein C6N40_02275 [Arenimonas caeni]